MVRKVAAWDNPWLDTESGSWKTERDWLHDLVLKLLRYIRKAHSPAAVPNMKQWAKIAAASDRRRGEKRERDWKGLAVSLHDLDGKDNEPSTPSDVKKIQLDDRLRKYLASLSPAARQDLLENPRSRQTKDLIRKVRRVAHRKNSPD